MKHALITGINGFAGSHLLKHLLAEGRTVCGLSKSISPEEKKAHLKDGKLWETIPIFQSDLGRIDQIESLCDWSTFSEVYHLAGTAFIPEGWKNPVSILNNNTVTTVNLLQALRNGGFRGRFLYVSSSDVYGKVERERLPITEESPSNPDSPYAASKLSSELFSRFFSECGIEIIIARPFNHIGPGQKNTFVVPSFIERVENAKRKGETFISVGDLDSERDFTDVRDVVKGYRILVESGTPGEIYNICSGRGVKIREVLEIIFELSEITLDVKVDPTLLRPGGPTYRYGSSEKIKKIGWHPEYSLKTTIQDMRSELLG